MMMNGARAEITRRVLKFLNRAKQINLARLLAEDLIPRDVTKTNGALVFEFGQDGP